MLLLLFGILFGFAFVISMIRSMRRLREVRERRDREVSLSDSAHLQKPSDEFHDRTWLPLCESIAEAASAKLNRPLMAIERRTIWRTRSPLVLEVVLNDIRSAPTAEDVASLLASLPPGMDRPDPTRWVDVKSIS